MKVKVTEEHIRDGIKCDSRNCAIALALTDALGMAVSVGPRSFFIKEANQGVYFDPEVSAKIRAFDKDKNIRPFEFEIPDTTGREES